MLRMNDLAKIVRSTRFGLKGLRHAYRIDRSFRMEIYLGLPIYVALGFLLAPFSPWEFLAFVFSYLFILVTELQNTAFEHMLERVHPEEHDIIGRSKDVSAAAVLVAFVFALVVVLTLLYSRYIAYAPFSLGGVMA